MLTSDKLLRRFDIQTDTHGLLTPRNGAFAFGEKRMGNAGKCVRGDRSVSVGVASGGVLARRRDTLGIGLRCLLACCAAFWVGCDDSSGDATTPECTDSSQCAGRTDGKTVCNAAGVCEAPAAQKECASNADCEAKYTDKTVCNAAGACEAPATSENECLTTFIYHNRWTSARTGGVDNYDVYLVGDFNLDGDKWKETDPAFKMQSDGDGTHTITVKWKKGETHQYKFFVSGWGEDSYKSIPNACIGTYCNNEITVSCGQTVCYDQTGESAVCFNGEKLIGNTNPPANAKVEWCRVTNPPVGFTPGTNEFSYGTPLPLKAQVYAPGITGRNGTHTGLMARVVLGAFNTYIECDSDDECKQYAELYGNSRTVCAPNPRNDIKGCVDPKIGYDTANFSIEAKYNSDYDGDAVENNDEYIPATEIKPDIGEWGIEFLFSADNGQNWTRCDGGGVYDQSHVLENLAEVLISQ